MYTKKKIDNKNQGKKAPNPWSNKMVYLDYSTFYNSHLSNYIVNKQIK